MKAYEIPDLEKNIIYKHIHIDDLDYFAMIDNQVRSEYTLCEEFAILPLIEKLYKDNNISINEKDLTTFPVEGYYYKTPGLSKYFQLVRNLQENPNVYNKIDLKANGIEDLFWLFGNTIWGTIKSDRTLSPFPRMKDILTFTLNKLMLKENWTIQNILNLLPTFATGNPNLVELAYLTDDLRCLTASAETNALYREMSFCTSGCGTFGFNPLKTEMVYHWDVTDKVEKLGKDLVDLYNEIIIKFQKVVYMKADWSCSYTKYFGKNFFYGNNDLRKIAKLIVKPNLENYTKFNKELEMPRVAMLGMCLDDGEYYHWILDKNKVKEVWSKGLITTESYQNNTEPANFHGWDFSGWADAYGKVSLSKITGDKTIPDIDGLTLVTPFKG